MSDIRIILVIMANTAAQKEFAIIEAAGKQYKVAVGDVVKLDKQYENFKEGEKITFDKVLFVDNGVESKIGEPHVAKAEVQAIFAEEGRDKKVRVHRFRSKSRYHRTYGHRQPFTKVKISAIK